MNRRIEYSDLLHSMLDRSQNRKVSLTGIDLGSDFTCFLKISFNFETHCISVEQ